jgi:hypothetical protein
MTATPERRRAFRTASGRVRAGVFLAGLAGLLLAVSLAAVGIGAVPVRPDKIKSQSDKIGQQ